MSATIVSVPGFPEVRTSLSGGQTAWTSFVFSGYLIAAFLAVLPAIAPFETSGIPTEPGSIFLVAPVSDIKGGINDPCFHDCGSIPIKVSGVQIDKSGLKLGITDDPSFEILKVLQRVDGLIAFASSDEPRYADHIFNASGSVIQSGASSAIDDYFALLLPELNQWPGLQALAKQGSINMSERVYLLFPPAYWNVVADSILKQAEKEGLSGSIHGATIRFDASVAAGIRVEAVYVGDRMDSTKAVNHGK